MLNALAFVQTGADALACVDAPLDPVPSPRPGSPAIFAPAFSFAADRPWWFDVGVSAPRVLSRDEWRRRFPPVPGRPVRPAWSGPDEVRFEAAFRSLKACLDAGVLRKGVPVTVMRASVPPGLAPALFRHALARVPDVPRGLFAYGLYRPADHEDASPEFIVGATPELLFEVDGRRLCTMAVAGTLPAEAGPATLEASAKNRDEHQSVIEDLLAQLAAWGRPEASPTEVRTFGPLEHLAADIRLEADAPLDFEAVARRLHPTPALGVYPRSTAGLAWLAGIDSAGERRRFGAPFGLRLPSGGGRCLVAIRNLQYHDGQLEIWAGCGVVPQSRYDDEWQEVLQKMQAVRALWDV